jgi:serine protease Do
MRSVIVLAALAVSACSSSVPERADAQLPATRSAPSAPAASAAAGSQIAASRRTAITTAVDRVSPAVVTVQTETISRTPPDMMEYFFGGRSGPRRSAGIGSGFIVRADGVIVTNAHVIGGASKVSVALRDGTTYDAKVVGSDETNDLAVLRIQASRLPVAPLGTSTDLLVGEWAVAIGNPFGFVLGNTEPSVSVGVISAVGRNLAGGGENGTVYVDMLQTDAAINPGNSGGPLINALGEVIGVNSSIYSPSGGSVGLGFAIPIDRTKRIVEDLLEHGAVRQPWVGLRLRTPNAESAREAANTGAVVARVTPGSPADQGGVRVGDEIVSAGARAVRNVFDWEARLLDVRVGETLPLTVRRGGRDVRVTLRAAAVPESNMPRVTVARELELVTLTETIRAERNVRATAGALVYRVSDRVSEQIGLVAGDVIVQIGRSRVGSAEAASTAINRDAERGPIVVVLERGGRLLQTSFYLR